jgi:hypothetical protein
MLGYGLIIACGFVITFQAVAGWLVTARQPAFQARMLLRISIIGLAALGLAAMLWGGWRTWNSHQELNGLADVEISGSDAEAQLQRIAFALGVDTKKSTTATGDEILRRLPTRVWHMRQVEQDAFGQALDEIPVGQRFPVVVRSIPSNQNSIAFSDDILTVLKAHGWTGKSLRDFGINNTLTGLLIAVPPDTRTEAEVPHNAKILIVMLEKAGLTPNGAPLAELSSGQFELVVGRGPK